MAIVEAKVKPERMKNKRAIRKKYWWRFGETTPALFAALKGKSRVLITTLHSQYLSFAFLPASSVFSHALGVFTLAGFADFAVLQSHLHELWARFFGSSLEERLRYTPSDCFETFPFPDNPRAESTLTEIGERYYTYRADLMVKNDQGLTDTYNRFHDPNETDPAIIKLRQLHDEMDRAMLAAYGWDDLDPECEFLLDYEDDEDDSGKSSRKKKPWRYRWPDALQEEVLARLLELNQQRAEEERLAGLGADKGKGKKKSKRASSKKKSSKKTSAKKAAKKTSTRAKKQTKARSKAKSTSPPAQTGLRFNDKSG